MSDDAQPPTAQEHDAAPDATAPKVPLSKETPQDAAAARTPGEPRPDDPWAPPAADPAGDPWAPPAADRAGGPGDTIASGGPAPLSVHDQQTITSLPADDGAGSPRQWAAPTAPANGTSSPFAPPSADAPATGGSPVIGAPDPFAPPNPFAPPAASAPHVQGGAVPPPPIAPDGPGQVPYGYPVGYGYPPAAGGGYYGWPGMAPMPSNGMGTAGLVLGILGAIVFCLWPLAIVLGVLGVIFGAIGRRKASRGEATNGGQALAGIICGVAGIVLGITMGVLVLVA
ncbi:DUF4190 domain-containing protein [Streptomyces sp. NPDC003362]